MLVSDPFGRSGMLDLPDNTFIAHMEKEETLLDTESAIKDSLLHPAASESLLSIARRKKEGKDAATAVVVVSDNTRPVPYRGQSGILMPVIDTLMEARFRPDEITVLVATGMHRPMGDDEILSMLDPRLFSLGIRVVNHDPDDGNRLTYLGKTGRGTAVYVDSLYVSADLKILTGLVESHFMAGASGGRKSVCPGLIGKESTYIFHGPELMDDPSSRDLVTEGNPVHEESLEVARMAGVDFIVNVTLDRHFAVTGVFSGALREAHEKAVEKLSEHVRIPVPYQADIVITHGGYVGINHYQSAKCGVAALGALRQDGFLLMLSDCTDSNPVGSAEYRTALALLRLLEPERFSKLLRSPDWVFLPEQWQVQQWAKVFRRIPMDHFYYHMPQVPEYENDIIPGNDMRKLSAGSSPSAFLDAAIADIERRTGRKREEMRIIYLEDGPYGIPYEK